MKGAGFLPSKLQSIVQLYNHQLEHITQSPAEWTAFLQAAARNYKLPFDEQLLVYAQRPNATAVLEIERWNEQFAERSPEVGKSDSYAG